MPYYLQRQSVNNFEALTIASGKNVTFEQQCACSFRRGESAADDYDFEYEEDQGLIEVKRVGVYLIFWNVSQQTGLPGDGQTFQLVIEDPDPLTEGTVQLKTTWHSIAGASTQLKVVNSIGSGLLLKKNQSDIVKIALQNVSKDMVVISPSSPIQAQLFIFGIGDSDGDMEVIHERLAYLQSIWGQTPEADFAAIFNRLKEIETHNDGQDIEIDDLMQRLQETNISLEEFLTPSNVYVEDSGRIPWMTTYCRRAENTYMFWVKVNEGSGQPLVEGGRIYLWKADANRLTPDPKNPWRALSWYSGNPITAPAWLYSGETSQLIPLHVDNQGLYFLETEVGDRLVVGGLCGFTINLILNEAGG